MGYCYLYAIACKTPGHFYIGTTTRPWGAKADAADAPPEHSLSLRTPARRASRERIRADAKRVGRDAKRVSRDAGKGLGALGAEAVVPEV